MGGGGGGLGLENTRRDPRLLSRYTSSRVRECCVLLRVAGQLAGARLETEIEKERGEERSETKSAPIKTQPSYLSDGPIGSHRPGSETKKAAEQRRRPQDRPTRCSIIIVIIVVVVVILIVVLHSTIASFSRCLGFLCSGNYARSV